MPLLFKEGRTLLSVQGLMQRRLELLDSPDKELKEVYWNNYFQTSDAIIMHCTRKFKIVLDSDHLRNLTPQSKLIHGGLVLTQEVYVCLDGVEFTTKDLESYANKYLTEAQVNNNPIWLALARDSVLLKEYAAKMFAMGKKYDYDTNMTIYLAAVAKQPIIRSFCSRELADGARCDVLSDVSLDYVRGRLVGVETLKTQSDKNLETKIRFSQN